MKNAGWKYGVDLAPGKFYSVFVDEKATLARRIDTTDLEFGLFHGQLLELKANTATFQFADEEGHWRMSLDLETGLSTKMGLVISSLTETEIQLANPPALAEEDITGVHGERIDQMDGQRIEVQIEGDFNLTASVVHRQDEMVIGLRNNRTPLLRTRSAERPSRTGISTPAANLVGERK